METAKGFTAGPEDITDPETPVNAPRLFVCTPTKGTEELRLITYQCNRITIGFLIRPAFMMDLGFYRLLDGKISRPLADLDVIIGDLQAKRAARWVCPWRLCLA